MTGFMTLGLKRTHDTLSGTRSRSMLKRTQTSRQHSPLSVAVILDVVFALAEGVPELDRPVARARDDLPVVSREADGEDIGGVADEAAGRVASVEVPQAECVVPRGGERELAVGGDDDVRDEVVVAVEDALRVAVLILVTGELPDDDRLVYATDTISARTILPCTAFANAREHGAHIPREAVRIMSGFSEEVATAVTQPLWPAIEPR